MMEILLARLVGTRDAANAYVAGIGGVDDEVVRVNCRELLSASPSFADQLVKRLLVESRARELVLVNAHADFISDICDAAARRHVDDRVRVAGPSEVGV